MPVAPKIRFGRRMGVTGMFNRPQIDDQRQRSFATAIAQTTNTSEAIYVLTAVSAWPGMATRRFRGPSRSVTRCAGPGLPGPRGLPNPRGGDRASSSMRRREPAVLALLGRQPHRRRPNVTSEVFSILWSPRNFERVRH
jgi:hypothetical protein